MRRRPDPRQLTLGSFTAREDDAGSGAIFSPCGRYRYWLQREWNLALPAILWIMLNPSIADARINDPTIRRCIAFSQAWGYGRMVVGNLFAFRSTDPSALERELDPVGPENDNYLLAEAVKMPVVVAWGTHGALHERDRDVLARLRRLGGLASNPQCLGVTKDGFPRHPLYVAWNTALVPYEGRP